MGSAGGETWRSRRRDRGVCHSLHPEPLGPVPDETARVARAAFREGPVYRQLPDVPGSIDAEAQCADLFAARDAVREATAAGPCGYHLALGRCRLAPPPSFRTLEGATSNDNSPNTAGINCARLARDRQAGGRLKPRGGHLRGHGRPRDALARACTDVG